VNTNKENSLANSQVIYDYTSFTHLDYPNHLACIIWFSGCNMRCDYCYNKDIVFAKTGKYSYNDILKFLESRKNLLDAVVLSGGEATGHDLVEFCQNIKKMGFKIKLDTNGTNFEAVKELVELNLLDYIALDYKAPKEKFTQITHSNKYDEFSKTLDYLIKKDFDFEARTTVHNDLLNEEDINTISSNLKHRGYKNILYIQEFLNTGTNIANMTNSMKKLIKSKLSDTIQIQFR